MMPSTGDSAPKRKRKRPRSIPKVPSLDTLVAAHPTALMDIFTSGEPADPTSFDYADMDGRLLGVEAFANTFALMRPLVRLSSRIGPWQGKRFESGGTSGTDRVLNLEPFRFRCDVAPSRLDGQPALILHYDGLGNPWPISRCRCELRTVGDHVAIGPAWMGDRLLCWWGLDTSA